MSPFVITSIVGAVCAVLIIMAGARGGRVDGRRYCRRCRYDLSGSATPPRCPECGRELSGRRRVRVGRRRPNGFAIVIGAALLLLAGGTLGLHGWVGARDIDWITLEPVWLLRRAARSDDVVAADAATAELNRRLLAGDLSPGQIGDLVDDALERQRDLDTAWTPEWSRFVEAAWYGRFIDDEVLKRYLKGTLGAGVTIVLDPRARSGGDVRFEVRVPEVRGTSGQSLFLAHVSVETVTLNGTAATMRARGGTWSVGRSLNGATERRYEGTANAFPDPGPAAVEISAEVVFSRAGPRPGTPNAPVFPDAVGVWQESSGDERRPDPAAVMLVVPVVLVAPIELQPTDATIVELVPDRSVADAIRASITAGPIALEVFGDTASVSADLVIDDPPLDVDLTVAFRPRRSKGAPEDPAMAQARAMQEAMIARLERQGHAGAALEAVRAVHSQFGEARIVGVVAGRAGERATHDVRSHLQDVGSVEGIDIVLRSRPELTSQRVGVRRVFDGEIVIEDVTIRRTVHPMPAGATDGDDTAASVADLVAGVDAADGRSAARAAAALRPRLTELDAAGRRELADALLATLADEMRVWSGAHSALLDALYDAGGLDDAQLAAVLRRARRAHWRARPRVEAGQPVPFSTGHVRVVGNAVTSAFRFVDAPLRVRFGDGPPRTLKPERSRSGSRSPRSAAARTQWAAAFTAPEAPGVHSYTVEGDVQVFSVDRPDGPPVAEWTWAGTHEVESVSGSTVLPDASYLSVDAARAALRVQRARAVVGPTGGRARAQVSLAVSGCPIGLSMVIEAHVGADVHEVGVWVVPPGESDSISLRVPLAPGDPPASITLILRPDAAAARSTLDVFTMLDAPIVLEDVRLTFERGGG